MTPPSSSHPLLSTLCQRPSELLLSRQLAQPHHPFIFSLFQHLNMADDKKRDDFTIEMNERNGKSYDSPSSPRHVPQAATPLAAVTNNPVFPVLSYCASSILMTVTNKFVLSGLGFNLNFFLLCVQVSQNQVGQYLAGMLIEK